MGSSGGGDESTILTFIREHLDPSGCGLLPGGYDPPGGEDDLSLSGGRGPRWAPGARDGSPVIMWALASAMLISASWWS
jgi:hypothetical protein